MLDACKCIFQFKSVSETRPIVAGVNLHEAIQEQREAFAGEHERRGEILDEMQRLAEQLDGAPAPRLRMLTLPPSSPPPELRPTSRGRPGEANRQASKAEIVDRAAAVLVLIAELQPVASGELMRRLDIGRGALKHTLELLRETRKITTEGQRSAMRYWITADRDALEAQRHGSNVRDRGKSIRPELRRRVLEAIKADPDALTQKRLAQALGCDEEGAAEATGELLTDGEVTLRGDGTYRAT